MWWLRHELFDIHLCPHIDWHSWMAWGQGKLTGLSSNVELVAHSSYISYVGATHILTSMMFDDLGIIPCDIFIISTSQPCLQQQYTTWILMHIIRFIWYFAVLPNFNVPFKNYRFKLSCYCTPFLEAYQRMSVVLHDINLLLQNSQWSWFPCR